jgi:carboxymethylenebutenolidase
MRDDGYRYDAVAAISAWEQMIAFLERKSKR